MKLTSLTLGLHRKSRSKLEHEKCELLHHEPQIIKKLKVEQKEFTKEITQITQIKPQNTLKMPSSRETFKILKGETTADNWDIEIPKVLF